MSENTEVTQPVEQESAPVGAAKAPEPEKQSKQTSKAAKQAEVAKPDQTDALRAVLAALEEAKRPIFREAARRENTANKELQDAVQQYRDQLAALGELLAA